MRNGFTLQDLLNGEHKLCGYLLLGLAPVTMLAGVVLTLTGAR